ncbi:MAG TPA: F0F1 ATP synthase subunit gamma, partial [Candidatus Binatia bacterium]
MATLKAIRKRISSIRNTQQITKAMKMVSAAKLRRAQEAAVAARPYAEKMTDLLKNLAARVASNAHPLLTVREEKRIQLVLLTSDRGLCGGYNANLIRAAEAFRREQGPEKEVQLTLIGRKGADYFRRRRAEISDRYV